MHEKQAQIIVDALQAHFPSKPSIKSDEHSTWVSYPVQVDMVPLTIGIQLGSKLGTGIQAHLTSPNGGPSWQGGFHLIEDLTDDGARKIASRIVERLNARK